MTETTFQQTHEYDPVEVRRSFRLLSMDVIFYICGLAFIDSTTVLPAFLSTLTDSALVIGAITAIRPAGLYVPQLWAAHYLRNRTTHIGYLLKVATVSRGAVTVFALVLFMAGPGDKALMLAAFIAIYAAFWFSEGAANVSWTDLVAKTIPERQRGRLFGFTQFGGGILALFAGLLVGKILSTRWLAYPMNYAVICGAAAVFFWASWISLSRVHEPHGISEEHDGDFLAYMKCIGRMLAGHAELKRFLLVQILISFLGLAAPFYILYAKETLRIGGVTVGFYLSTMTAGSIVAAALGGYVSDHLGPKRVIMMSVGTGILSPVLALLTGGVSVWLYGLVFLMVGATNGSAWIGLTNYLLELADPKERKSYIGLMNTANTPAAFLPIVGGLIVDAVSYRAVFVVTAAALCLALVLALGLVTKKRT